MKFKKPGRTRITVTVVRLNGQRVVRNLRTSPGQYLTPKGLEEQLRIEAERVEHFFKGCEFRLVPLTGGCFNFIEITAEMAAPVVSQTA
jgi:hypothetical protein